MSEFAVLSSAGPAAIAIVQISGARVPEFLERHVRIGGAQGEDVRAAGAVFRGVLCDADGEVLDQILISSHADPPEWSLRLHLHGSPWVVRRCSELLTACGFAERRAATVPVWGGRDAIEVESYALLPQMVSLRGARWLLCQAGRLRAALASLQKVAALEEGRATCRELAARANVFDWFARPARIVLAGPPNAGKSTLANALAAEQASLVSPVPGTTRDWVETPGLVHGFPVVWVDTAGLGAAADELERAGIERTRKLLAEADGVLVVLDGTAQVAECAAFVRAHEDLTPACVALNKADRADFSDVVTRDLPNGWRQRLAVISATQGTDLEVLMGRLLRGLGRDEARVECPGAFTGRQAALLERAAQARDRAGYLAALRGCLNGDPEARPA